MAETSPSPSAPAGPWLRLWRSPARAVLAALVGAGAGAAYAHFVGCQTGSCPITSNIWTAGLYGAFIGGVAAWPSRRAAEAKPQRVAEGWEP